MDLFMLVIWVLGLDGLSLYCLGFQEVSAFKNKNVFECSQK